MLLLSHPCLSTPKRQKYIPLQIPIKAHSQSSVVLHTSVSVWWSTSYLYLIGARSDRRHHHHLMPKAIFLNRLPDLIECPEFHACPFLDPVDHATCFFYTYIHIEGVLLYSICIYATSFRVYASSFRVWTTSSSPAPGSQHWHWLLLHW
jgi:hypothetical protein